MNVIIRDTAPIITKDESGAWRVGTSDVHVELVVKAFQQGESPDRIANQLDGTILLAEVYDMLAYYLRNREEIDGYLRRREEEAREMRARVAAMCGQPDEPTPLLKQAAATFERDFPGLYQQHPRRWVAYHGENRLLIGREKDEVLQGCYAQGYPDAELFVACIQPISSEEWADWEEAV